VEVLKEKKNLLSTLGIKTPDDPGLCLVTVSTVLLCLQKHVGCINKIYRNDVTGRIFCRVVDWCAMKSSLWLCWGGDCGVCSAGCSTCWTGGGAAWEYCWGLLDEFWGRNGAEDKLGDYSRVADFVLS
jgi:hypothetical protein